VSLFRNLVPMGKIIDQMFPSKATAATGTSAAARGSFATEAQDKNRVEVTAKQEDLAGDSFWQFIGESIDPKRWNQQFPYQLLILDYSSQNGQQGEKYSIADGWSFTLPIPPESLSLDTPFAITTSVTLGGISEEHNGAPIRTLTFAGTTGVLPNKESSMSLAARMIGQAAANTTDGQMVDSILGGRTPAFDATVAAITDVQNTLGTPFMNLMSEQELATTDKGRGTGYYQFRLLQQFLELYVSNKKNGVKEWRNKRLAVAIWKDQAVYVVTPQNFRYRRSSEDPLAYHYELSFKAWRRVKLADQVGIDRPLSDYLRENNDPNLLQQGLNAILAARSTFSRAYSALEAVQGNVIALVFEPLRQITGLLKDALGAQMSLADMPATVISEAKGALIGFNTADDRRENKRASRARNKQMEADLQSMSATTGFGLTAYSIQSKVGKTAEEINKVFNDPAISNDALATVNMNSLQLPLVTRQKMQQDLQKIKQLTRDDFAKMRDDLVGVASHYADSVGAGSDVYDETFNRATSATTKTPSDDDFDVLFAFNECVMQLNAVISQQKVDTTRLDAVNYVAGLARRSGIAFTTPASKFPVPFPYGSTLEQLAQNYLGDPNRWHEIVALNGLRAPYVDEEGAQYPLLTNGRLGQITVADPSPFWVGQMVTLTANNVTSTQRRVTKIDKVHPTMAILHLGGPQDLDKFLTMADAKVHAFLPDTVNSRMVIYIPSQSRKDQGLTTLSIPGVDAFDPFLSAGGVDFLLGTDNDLVLTPSGEPKWAYGLQNMVQRAKIAVATPKGSVPQHATFGIGLKPGASTADIDAKQLVESLEGLFRDDPAFSGVVKATVEKKGPTASIRLHLAVANSTLVLPVHFEVG